MARITWDGRALEIEDGTDLLTGALDAGIFVPHLCFHPALSAPAHCRLCAIEVRAAGGQDWLLTTACDAPATDGMAVRTRSDTVRQARAAALEFQLVRHPLACPSCDRSGECELQEFSQAYGRDRGPHTLPEAVASEVRNLGDVRDLGNHVAIDAGKCIRCTRCVRFCREVTGTEELALFDRADRVEVDTFAGSRLDNPLSANTVDLCPSGALIDTRFRLQPAWRLRGADSVCAGCATGCSIRIDVDGGQVRRLKPRVNMAVNEYWMCDDGRHGWTYVNSPERLTHPVVRPGPAAPEQAAAEDAAASWDDAFDAAHAAFAACRSQGQQVGVILGGQMTNEEAYLSIRLARTWDSEWIALRPSTRGEGDITFKSGFTIRADKAANRRGIVELAAGLGTRLRDLDQLLEAVHRGEVAAAFVVGGGPEVRPDDDEIRALAAIAGKVVVLDIMQDEVAALARVVLPGGAFAEKDGTLTNVDGLTQRLRRAAEPVSGSLDDLEILRRLAARFAAPEAALQGAEAVFAAMGENVASSSAFAGLTYERLAAAESATRSSAQAYGGGWSSLLQARGFIPVADHNKRVPTSSSPRARAD